MSPGKGRRHDFDTQSLDFSCGYILIFISRKFWPSSVTMGHANRLCCRLEPDKRPKPLKDLIVMSDICRSYQRTGCQNKDLASAHPDVVLQLSIEAIHNPSHASNSESKGICFVNLPGHYFEAEGATPTSLTRQRLRPH